MGPAEVEALLNYLAVQRHVAASTQSQALNALVFLYGEVLVQPLGEMHGLWRVQRRQRVPVVLTRDKVRRVLTMMEGTSRLMVELMYGTGLRVRECVTLRVKDVDVAAGTISVRDSKGSKDRTTVLPSHLAAPLQQHRLRVATLHRDDLACGAELAPMPDALARKYPSASGSWAWQFVFRQQYRGPGVIVGAWCVGTRRIRRYSARSSRRSSRRKLHRYPNDTIVARAS